MSHKQCPGVEYVVQIYRLSRDRKEMLELFMRSQSAWQGYAKRHPCTYRLWNADEVNTFMQLHAPDVVKNLYRHVRFPIQRVDMARFFILFKYGGLYADLDVFPHRESFPPVYLGLCKIIARETKATYATQTRVGDRVGYRLLRKLSSFEDLG